METGSKLRVALDVWEPEPNVNCQLLERVQLATPHISGYSREGKVRGTEMLAEAFYQWREGRTLDLKEDALTEFEGISLRGESLSKIILASYDVADDDRRMREAMMCEGSEREASNSPTERKSGSVESVAEAFDRLRKEYPQRHEFSYFSAEVPEYLREKVRLLGFI